MLFDGSDTYYTICLRQKTKSVSMHKFSNFVRTLRFSIILVTFAVENSSEALLKIYI